MKSSFLLKSPKNRFSVSNKRSVIKLTGAFYAGNFREWSQSSLVIIIPATPIPIHSLLSTSKYFQTDPDVYYLNELPISNLTWLSAVEITTLFSNSYRLGFPTHLRTIYVLGRSSQWVNCHFIFCIEMCLLFWRRDFGEDFARKILRQMDVDWANRRVKGSSTVYVYHLRKWWHILPCYVKMLISPTNSGQIKVIDKPLVSMV